MICKEELEQFTYEVTLMWSEKVGGLSEFSFKVLKFHLYELLKLFPEDD